MGRQDRSAIVSSVRCVEYALAALWGVASHFKYASQHWDRAAAKVGGKGGIGHLQWRVTELQRSDVLLIGAAAACMQKATTGGTGGPMPRSWEVGHLASMR
jgi:hypothetical protein